MVESKVSARLPSLREVILTQTDTTVGFLSQNASKLADIKSRDRVKPFIEVYNTLKEFSKHHRVPNSKRTSFRRAKKTSFIIKQKAFRISPTSLHSQILRNSLWNYSSSANESGKHFRYEFCEDKADIIIEDKNGLRELEASKLFKINHVKQVRLR